MAFLRLPFPAIRILVPQLVAAVSLSAAFAIAGADNSGADDNSAGTESEATVEPESKVTISRRESNEGWNASTRTRETESSGEWSDGTIRFRAYDRFNRLGPALGPGIGPRGLAVGVDVAADIETCPDGRTRIRSMNIGGIDYELSDGCKSLKPDSGISISRGTDTTIETSETFTLEEASGDGRRIRCEPRTWTCRTEPE